MQSARKTKRSRRRKKEVEMDKEKGHLKREVQLKALSDGSLDRNKVIYVYSRCEPRYRLRLLSS